MFGNTKIVFESNRSEPLIKNKEIMTAHYQESVPMRFCKLLNYKTLEYFKHYLIHYRRKLLL